MLESYYIDDKIMFSDHAKNVSQFGQFTYFEYISVQSTRLRAFKLHHSYSLALKPCPATLNKKFRKVIEPGTLGSGDQ